MPFTFEAHRQQLIAHLIALEALDPDYAVWALNQARLEPSGLYRGILADVKAQKARIAATTPTPGRH